MSALREAIASAVNDADWIKVDEGSGEDVAVLVEEAIKTVLIPDVLLCAAVAYLQDERRYTDRTPDADRRDLDRAIGLLQACVELQRSAS